MLRAPVQREGHVSAREALSSYVGPIALALALVSAYYLFRWHSLTALVAALDHDPQLFLDFTANYLPQARSILSSAAPVPGYFYSAFFALLLLPFAWLDNQSAMIAWGLVQVISAVALCALPVVRLVPLNRGWAAAYVAVFVTSVPVLHTLRWGQVSIILTLLVIAAFHCYSRDQWILTGALIAIAAAIKFYPAVFILYFVMKRDWRVCASFALTFLLAYVLVPAAVLGPRDWFAFEAAATGAIVKATWVASDINSQYFPHVVARWLFVSSRSGAPVSDSVRWILMLLGYASFLLNLTLVWAMQRRNVRPMIALVLLFLSLPFAVTTSWPHYFAFLPFCQVVVLAYVLAGRSRAKSSSVAAAVLLVLSVAFSNIVVFGLFASWVDYSGLGMLFAADLFLLVAMYTLIIPRVFGRSSLRWQK